MDTSSTLLEAQRRRPEITRRVLQWAKANGRQYEWRRAGRSAYEILIAEVLLKRTTSTAAARVYGSFLRSYPSIAHLADADEAELAMKLAPVGLQRQRARDIKRMARCIADEEGGELPSSLKRLLCIPGLGEYSARAILSLGHGYPVAVVDANVQRVIQRIFGGTVPAAGKTQAVADAMLPRRAHERFNFALLDLGALVCRYQNPRCSECPLRACCDYAAGKSPTNHVDVEGCAIRKSRLEKRVSLVELSRRSRVSKLTIINLEAGRTRPRHETIEKLRAALGV